MELEKIISISGKPGLYKLISQVKNGFIIEDVANKKKTSISNSSQVSLLDNVSIYTTEKEVPLFEIFENIAKQNKYQETISHKVPDTELKDFMTKALPNYDQTRVYVSDIKKLIQWYNILHTSGYITPESFVKTEEQHEEKPSNELKKPAKKKTTNTDKPVVPKAKASTHAKSTTKSTQRKQG